MNNMKKKPQHIAWYQTRKNFFEVVKSTKELNSNYIFKKKPLSFLHQSRSQ